MKAIKLSDYFEIKKPEYIYLKLLPMTSIRNYDSDKIAKSIASLYRNIRQSIDREDKKYFFNVQSKVMYYIYIEKTKVEFFFIVPKQHLSLIKGKINDTWKGITVDQVKEIPGFSETAQKYYMTFRKEDALSLSTDRRTNTLLSSMLNVIQVMEQGDKVGVFYNFMPCSTYTWRSKHENTVRKYNEFRPIDREKFNFSYMLKLALCLLLDVVKILVDSLGEFTATERTEEKKISFPKRELSSDTIKKHDASIIKTQILVLSESEEKMQAKNNARNVCESFRSITGDNELVYRKSFNCRNLNLLKRNMNTDTIIVSPDECQQFIALPGREILDDYQCIEKVDTFESETPLELRTGTMYLGECVYKGQKCKVYLTSDPNLKYLTLVIIGPTRAGKSKLIANLSKNALDNEETTILFDFCGNAELSAEVAAVIDPSKVLNIDCSDFDALQGLGYNEVTPNSDDVFEVYRCVKAKTSQLMTLINSIAGDDLKDRMERYLEAASVVVFIQNGAIKEIFQMLQDHVLRRKFIDSIPESQKENMAEYILALEELDEYTRGTKDTPSEVVGTKISYVQGILNRVSKLKQNTYMELMLKKDCKDNINLIDEMQKKQLICIKMPEIMFNTEVEKDLYATYWLTKIWGALQKRKWDYPDDKDRVKVNIVFDELYQVPNCQMFLKSKLSQIAKFSCKPIISCHYLGQIGIIRNELKAANSSYMLIAGSDKDNFNELKEELAPYTLEDLLNMKRYQSLNIIKYEKGYAKFITQLPPPLKEAKVRKSGTTKEHTMNSKV